MRIGIDLDNTIINYDQAFHAAAVSLKLVPASLPATKRAVKTHIHMHHAKGDIAWQQLQGYVYGRGIEAATFYEGVPEFFSFCRMRGWDIVIVSHKTILGHFDPTACNLRDAARDWLRARDIFTGPAAIPETALYFETTRAEKVMRIAHLHCDYFIDDLIEVFEEYGFPADTKPILFSEHSTDTNGISTFVRWSDIQHAFEQLHNR
jgi:hypothetical protein